MRRRNGPHQGGSRDIERIMRAQENSDPAHRHAAEHEGDPEPRTRGWTAKQQGGTKREEQRGVVARKRAVRGMAQIVAHGIDHERARMEPERRYQAGKQQAKDRPRPRPQRRHRGPADHRTSTTEPRPLARDRSAIAPARRRPAKAAPPRLVEAARYLESLSVQVFDHALQHRRSAKLLIVDRASGGLQRPNRQEH